MVLFHLQFFKSSRFLGTGGGEYKIRANLIFKLSRFSGSPLDDWLTMPEYGFMMRFWGLNLDIAAGVHRQMLLTTYQSSKRW